MTDIVCFGEVLWDLLPRGRFLGGAPLNVAYHLRRLGLAPALVSAVGADALGELTLTQMTAAGVGTGFVTRDPRLPTGTVTVSLDAAGQATYQINQPVAWDEIVALPFTGAVEPGVLVHGSLALRSATNRATLRAWIDARPCVRVCDLNLRAPHDDVATFAEFLHGVDILKLNADEARRLMPAEMATATSASQAAHLSATYGCRVVCITLGGDGALLRHEEKTYFAGTPKVTVRDTIGAGDAFTAALVAGFIRGGRRPEWSTILRRACALGAFVASRDGAQPSYEVSDVPGLE